MSVFNDVLMKSYVYKDNVFTFEGCVSIEEDDVWVSPWRINYKQAEFSPCISQYVNPKWTTPVALQCSGVRLCFSTDSQTIIVELADHADGLKLDLYSNGVFAEEIILEEGVNLAEFKPLDGSLKQIEIWLDHRHTFRLKKLLIKEGARICKTVSNKKRWIHYGSSISHSREADMPSGTWTSIAARKLGLHLTNLGYAASGIIQPMAGRQIRDLSADYITLKLGINLHGGRLNQGSFFPNVVGFIQIIREKHPDTPLAIISPICSPTREVTRALEGGLTLEEMRKCLREIVEICKKYGDRNIYYVDGLKILGHEALEYLPDGLHPNSEGQQVIADHIIKEVFERFPNIFIE